MYSILRCLMEASQETKLLRHYDEYILLLLMTIWNLTGVGYHQWFNKTEEETLIRCEELEW